MIVDKQWALCRLYFNRIDDPKGAWSVDQGAGSEELIFRSVVFYAVSKQSMSFGRTNEDAEVTKIEDEPIAWIELKNVRLIGETGGRLVIEV
jgi:hypothetical protein